MVGTSSIRALFASSLLALTVGLQGCSDPVAGESIADSETQQTSADALRTAAERKEKVDERYARAFGRVGNMLTEAQQKRFTNAFHRIPDVATTETDYRTRAEVLAREIEAATRNQSTIVAYDGGVLDRDLALLAQTPSAIVALKVAMRLLTHQIDIGVSDAWIYDQIVGPALGLAFLERVTETGSASTARDQIGDILESGGESMALLGDALKGYQALSGVDPLNAALDIPSAPVLRAVNGIAGLVALFEIGHSATSQDSAAEMIREFLESSPKAVSGVSDGLGMLQRIVFGAESETLAKVSSWAGNVGNVMGGLLSAYDQMRLGGTWDDSATNQFNTIANAVSIAAAIAAFTPYGGAASVIAFGFKLLASYVEHLENEAETKRDVRASLAGLNLPPALVTLMTENLRPELVDALRDKAGLGAADIQWLATKFPASVSVLTVNDYNRFKSLRLRFVLDPAETMALLRQVAGTSEADRRLADFFGCVSGRMIDVRTSKDTVLEELTSCGNAIGGGAGVDAGVAYLARK